MSGSTTNDVDISLEVTSSVGALNRLGTADERNGDRAQISQLSALTRRAYGCIDNEPLESILSGPLADARSDPDSIIASAMLRAGGISVGADNEAKRAFLEDLVAKLDRVEELSPDELKTLEALYMEACEVIEASMPVTPWEIVSHSIDDEV
jgi:hypothetical protein